MVRRQEPPGQACGSVQQRALQLLRPASPASATTRAAAWEIRACVQGPGRPTANLTRSREEFEATNRGGPKAPPTGVRLRQLWSHAVTVDRPGGPLRAAEANIRVFRDAALLTCSPVALQREVGQRGGAVACAVHLAGLGGERRSRQSLGAHSDSFVELSCNTLCAVGRLWRFWSSQA